MSGYIGTTPVPEGSISRQTTVCTSGQTSFPTSGYLAGGQFVLIHLNGVLLKLSDDYTAANGSDIVLTSGAASGDILEFTSFNSFSVSDTVSASSGGTFSGDVKFGDNVKAIFGDSSDLTIEHNGTNSTITNTTGDLLITNSSDDSDVYIQSDDGSGGNAPYFLADGSSGQAKLYHNDSGTGTLRLNTSSDGIDIIGHADIEGHFTATDGCTITTADNSTQLTLTSTDADATEGPRLDLRRDSPSPADGDLIGTLRYLGDDDGGTTTVFGEIQVEADDITDGSEDGEMRLMIRNNGNLRNAVEIGATEVVFNENSDDVNFRVESDTVTHALFVEGSSGNLGVGTSSPTSSIHAVGGAGANIAIQSTAGSHWRLGDAVGASNGTFVIYDYTNSAARIAIEGSGRTTHSATINGHHTKFVNSGSSSPDLLWLNFDSAAPDNNSQYFAYCSDSSTLRCAIWSDGDIDNHDNSYGGTSDQKLKQQIADSSSQWDDIKALQVRKFKFNSDVEGGDSDEHWRLGVIAQEVESAGMSGLVNDRVDKDEDGNALETTTKSVKYSVLYMKAVKALQEAMDRIETLETKVAALEAE